MLNREKNRLVADRGLSRAGDKTQKTSASRVQTKSTVSCQFPDKCSVHMPKHFLFFFYDIIIFQSVHCNFRMESFHL